MAHFVEIECNGEGSRTETRYINTAHIVAITPRVGYLPGKDRELGAVGSIIHMASSDWEMKTDMLPKDVFFLCQ